MPLPLCTEIGISCVGTNMFSSWSSNIGCIFLFFYTTTIKRLRLPKETVLLLGKVATICSLTMFVALICIPVLDTGHPGTMFHNYSSMWPSGHYRITIQISLSLNSAELKLGLLILMTAYFVMRRKPCLG